MSTVDQFVYYDDKDDEVKDFSKVFKDCHIDRNGEEDNVDTIKVYKEEGTPMVSVINTPLIASRKSPLESLDSECDEEYFEPDYSSSPVSDSSVFLPDIVSPSELPASPSDIHLDSNDGNNNRANLSSNDDDEGDEEDDMDDLLADVIQAGIPKRRRMNKSLKPKLAETKVAEMPSLPSAAMNNLNKITYLETDIDSIINYEKFALKHHKRINSVSMAVEHSF